MDFSKRPDFWMCPNVRKNRMCPNLTHCRYAHTVYLLQPQIRHPLYKTTPCRNYQTQKGCLHGASRCRFNHGEQFLKLDNGMEFMLVQSAPRQFELLALIQRHYGPRPILKSQNLPIIQEETKDESTEASKEENSEENGKGPNQEETNESQCICDEMPRIAGLDKELLKVSPRKLNYLDTPVVGRFQVPTVYINQELLEQNYLP